MILKVASISVKFIDRVKFILIHFYLMVSDKEVKVFTVKNLY